VHKSETRVTKEGGNLKEKWEQLYLAAIGRFTEGSERRVTGLPCVWGGYGFCVFVFCFLSKARETRRPSELATSGAMDVKWYTGGGLS